MLFHVSDDRVCGVRTSGSTVRRWAGTAWVNTVRIFLFTLFFILFGAAIAYGLSVGDFWETLSNGAMICLTCIGVA